MKTYSWLLCSLLAWAVGCGGTTPIAPSSSAPIQGSGSAAVSQESGVSPVMQPAAPSEQASGQSSKAQTTRDESQPAEAKERPGLATQFGEDIQRSVHHASFVRDTPTSPFVITTIWYNDATGSKVMAQNAKESSAGPAAVELFNGGLVVRLLDEQGRVLPGLVADKKPCAIGEEGARYTIGIQNRTDYAFEIVASVDGLSVIDGRPASFERRGYLLFAHQEIAIEGFRTSKETVAAFRFGKVSQSYSVEMGHGDRNVGVIGVAFFHEKGKSPVYSGEDSRLREQANPFPGEYSPRPTGR